MKVRNIIEILKSQGWEMVRCRGDHRQFRVDGNPYVVTVAGHLRDDIPRGTMRNIERLSGIRF